MFFERLWRHDTWPKPRTGTVRNAMIHEDWNVLLFRAINHHYHYYLQYRRKCYNRISRWEWGRRGLWSLDRSNLLRSGQPIPSHILLSIGGMHSDRSDH